MQQIAYADDIATQKQIEDEHRAHKPTQTKLTAHSSVRTKVAQNQQTSFFSLVHSLTPATIVQEIPGTHGMCHTACNQMYQAGIAPKSTPTASKATQNLQRICTQEPQVVRAS